MKTKLILIFSGFFLLVEAQLAINGTTCPDYLYSPPCVNLNLTLTNEKLVGIWFVHSNIPHFFEQEMKCSYLNITAIGENHLEIRDVEFHSDGEPREIIGTIEYSNDTLTSFYYTDLYLPFFYHTVALTADIWVMVSCNECGFYEHDGAGIYAYVFTRLQNPLCESYKEALTALARCNIPQNAMTLHDQAGCPFC